MTFKPEIIKVDGEEVILEKEKITDIFKFHQTPYICTGLSGGGKTTLAIDLIYTLMWLEELIPNYYINFSDVPNINEMYIVTIKKFYDEWNIIKNKRIKREISYKEYIEWKLNYDLKEVGGLYGKNM